MATKIEFDPGDKAAPLGSFPRMRAETITAGSRLKDVAMFVRDVTPHIDLLREGDRFKVLCDSDGVQFTSWGAFCEAPVPYGLNHPCEMVERVRGADPKDLVTEVKANPGKTRAEAGAMGGRGNKAGSDTTSFKDRGSSYIGRRLARDANSDNILMATAANDLLNRIEAGGLSFHAAGIEAGFIEKKLQISLDPARAATALRRHFTGDRLTQLREALNTA